MATTRLPVAGLQDLGKALQSLKGDMQVRAARRATSAAAKIVKASVIKAVEDPRAAEPYTVEGELVQPGNISANVISKNLSAEQTPQTAESIVTVRGKAAHGYASRIGSLQEFGTVKMAARPFMAPGFAASKNDALNAMAESLRADVAAAAKKGSS